jgi:circadian clock protein KaiC
LELQPLSADARHGSLAKAPTGISGLDEVPGGGLLRGRPTIITGRAGCGKTLLSMEFLVRGAREFGEPGVFVSFEELPHELVENMASLGFDVAGLEEGGKLLLEHVRVERSEIEETGEYDLEALFIRLGFAIDQVGAKRIVLDTLEALFAGLPNQSILRAELRRLFRWLKERGMTAVVTAERGEGTLTRHGLEEYVSDCVILLDHRVEEQLTTRRLRVVKYRGSSHGTNEYPFLIGDTGISLLPITSYETQQVYRLRLYVTGASRSSLQAIANLKQFCRQYLDGRYELEVIDLYQQPELARQEQLLVAPTLVKTSPPPVRRLIGTLSNSHEVMRLLDVYAA